MAKIKICPECHTSNSPGDVECCECGYDLSGVPLSEEAFQESTVPHNEPEPGASSEDMDAQPLQSTETTESTETKPAKICTCGQINSPTMKFCAKCRGSIKNQPRVFIDAGRYQRAMDELQEIKKNIQNSETPRTPVREHTGTPVFTLKSATDDYSFSIDPQHSLAVIGRENQMAEYLHDKGYVSRRHAKVGYRGDLVSITDLNSSNGTFINYRKITAGEEELLHEGDRVSLGGPWNEDQKDPDTAYFTVQYSKDEQ